MNSQSEVVSFENDLLLLVDANDHVLEYLNEAACHEGEIEEWKWVAQDERSDHLARRPGVHTPWLQLEWAEWLRTHATELPASRLDDAASSLGTTHGRGFALTSTNQEISRHGFLL